MPRRRFIRDDDWQQQPHVKDGPPPSLWWYRRPDRHSVINTYINRYKRGRAVPDDFKGTIVQALDDLSSLQNKSNWGQSRTLRYWSIPAYAQANNMQSATLMKWLREMEAIAKQLFPDSVPSSRKPRKQLTDEDKEIIRKRYLAGEDCKKLAEEFRIPPAHVGQLCRDEKAVRDAERQRLMDEHNARTSAPASGEPEIPF
jgi:hypothetical protein